MGDWLVSASILQCTDAVYGAMRLSPTGDLVYAPHGGLVGRGIGWWVVEGPLIGFQLDIFQYAPASKKHVQSGPQRFRGIAKIPDGKNVWLGEWYYCMPQMPPKIV